MLLTTATAHAGGTLTDNQRIASDVLSYDLQYRVYLPEGYKSHTDLAVLYVVDGQSYIKQGKVPRVLNRLIDSGKIEPVVVVFVDARDPDKLNKNRRNAQFFCNNDYLEFYRDELIPEIEQHYPVAQDREKRTVLGLSFGGLNSACFGLFGFDTFSGIGMQSPAYHPVPKLLSAYEEMPLLPLRVFLSTGKPNDNTKATRELRDVLQNKGYPMKYIEVREGHNWNNWRPLIDNVLRFFYAVKIEAS
jgi:enterochelin esterase-like enzyme